MTEQIFKYPLGIEAKEKVTGVVGIITSRLESIAGCRQYCVTPKAKPDGTAVAADWWDEERIEPTGIDENTVVINAVKSGGPTGSERPSAR